MHIDRIHARQIFDSRGNPTVEVDVTLNNGITARAAVPSGASVGSGEVLELRDTDLKAFFGKGVVHAVSNVNGPIAQALHDRDPKKQREIDETMIKLDGTPNKKNLGANAILAVSLAVSKAAAYSSEMSLYEYYGSLIGNDEYVLPMPIFNIFNGGLHAGFATDIQEYILFPIGASSFSHSMRIGVEIFQTLKKILQAEGYPVTVGDEGGFAPRVKHGNTEPLELILKAIKQAGYRVGEDVALGLDVAANSFSENGNYILKKENKKMNSEQMIQWYAELINKYPIVSIEDGLSESDWHGWKEMMTKLGGKIQIVGDDLLVTNAKLLQTAIDEKAANAIIIKPNQIGTLSETIDTVVLAKKAGFNTILSHRSGETEDVTIAHLAVGLASGQIKTGSVSRTDRVAKYNELLRIEEELGDNGKFGATTFHPA